MRGFSKRKWASRLGVVAKVVKKVLKTEPSRERGRTITVAAQILLPGGLCFIIKLNVFDGDGRHVATHKTPI